jgi:glutaconate CoA-transferase subunit B
MDARVKESPSYSTSELLAVMCSRAMKDGQIIFAGVGVPLLGATLAQRRHAPSLTILFEGGIVGPFIRPGRLPLSTNEMRTAERANMLCSPTDVLALMQRGYVDVGFIGGAQIDQYANVNSSHIGSARQPAPRLPGSGGGNDISSLTNTIVIMPHEKKRFVPNVDFITSPGYLSGGDSRQRSGLIAGGVLSVITNLCLFETHPGTTRLMLKALYPGISLEEVLDNMGFKPEMSPALDEVEPPSAQELAVLNEIDPDRMYLK